MTRQPGADSGLNMCVLLHGRRGVLRLLGIGDLLDSDLIPVFLVVDRYTMQWRFEKPYTAPSHVLGRRILHAVEHEELPPTFRLKDAS